MYIKSTWIDDSYAEAFGMKFIRLIVTADDEHWLAAAQHSVCGYGCSVIGCDAEIGLESILAPRETPDGRSGFSLLAFDFSAPSLGEAIVNRTGQCLMTCPTTAVYDGLVDAEQHLALGQQLRYFGDGFQKSKLLEGQRYWRIPVMDGEFVVSEQMGLGRGVAGGNFIIQAHDQARASQAAKQAVEAISAVAGVITPFPGGVVRSGSKVGSKYRGLKASTNDQFCPSLRGQVDSQLTEEANACYEIVIDGTSEAAVATAMIAGIHAACDTDILSISAGNYGGELGKHHFHLRQLLGTDSVA